MRPPLPRTYTVAAPLLLAVALGTATAHLASAQTATQPAAPKAKTKAKSRAESTPPASAPIDLNTATAEQMQETLPGVGEVTARRIVAGRPYATIDELSKAGVPARTIDQIRTMVTVSPPRPPAAEKARATPKETVAKAKGVPAARVDLNTANAEQLESLPGIGPAHAREIMASRPFARVDDLEKVKGIGKARVDELRPLVTLSAPAPTPAPAAGGTAKPPTAKAAPKSSAKAATKTAAGVGKPVNINTASRDELDALPGIGPVKAEAILEYRKTQPFKSKEDIMKVKGIKDGEFAKIRDVITVE